MVFNRLALREFVENNPKLVTRKESKRYPGLFVLKYAKKVFYDNLWHLSPLLLECRGLVVDSSYNVVVKPFTKVFNYGENGTTIGDDEFCTAVRKVNGFMACATYDPRYSDKLIISTTGSLDSDFVDIAEKHIRPLEENILKSGYNETLIFEICDENDPHIISEELGPYLIGGFIYNDMYGEVSEAALDSWARIIECKRPNRFIDRFSVIKEKAKSCKHEGFMVYSDSGKSLKIKSPYYLVTKFIARMREEKLFNLIASGNRKAAMKNIDEEYYPLLDNILDYKDYFIMLDEQNKISFIQEFLERHKK